MTLRRRCRLVLLALTLCLSGAVQPPTAAAPAEPLVVSLKGTARGADTPMLHMVGTTIIDGDRRVDVDYRWDLVLIGRIDGGYLVQTESELFAVDATTGDLRTVREGGGSTPAELLAGGRWVVVPGAAGNVSRVEVIDVATGALVQRWRLRGYLTVLDTHRRRVLLQGERRVVSLRVGSDKARRVAGEPVGPFGAADIRHDLLTLRDGRCIRVVRLSEPSQVRWSRCNGVVPVAASPDGSVLAAFGSSGQDGFRRLQLLRASDGRVLQRFEAPRSFSILRFEDNAHVVVLTRGTRKRMAAVRTGTDGTVERVSAVERPAEQAYDGPNDWQSPMGWSFPVDSAGAFLYY